MSVSFGKNKSKQSSRVLNEKERRDYFNTGVSLINQGREQFDFPEFGLTRDDFAQLGDNDFSLMRDDALSARLDPLMRWADDERGRIDQSLADRGLFTSGIAEQAQGDFSLDLADKVDTIGKDVSNDVFSRMMAQNQQRNAFNFDIENARMMAEMSPYDYLKDLYNIASAGNFSSGKSSGFNASFAAKE